MRNPLFIGVCVFVALAILSQIIAYQQYVILSEERVERAREHASIIKDNIRDALSHSLSATKTMAFIVEHYGVPSDFDSVASAILASNRFIDAVQLTDKGRITHVYPRAGNEVVLGLDVLADSAASAEAFAAIQKRALYFAGPMHLRQGGIGAVGRLPIYKDGKFMGFSVVIVKFETLLRASGLAIEGNRDYDVQLSKMDPLTNREQFFLPVTFDVKKSQASAITVPEGEWKLYVHPTGSGKWLGRLLPFSLGGLLLSVLAGLLAWQLANQPKKLDGLVKLRTRQVGDLNRLYLLTSKINHMMVKVKDEPSVLSEVCKVAVDEGRFAFAWIAMIDNAKKTADAVARAGYDNGYLEALCPINLTGDHEGPIAKLLRTGSYVYCNDISTDMIMAPWADAAKTRGFQSLILLPIRKFGTVVGSLNLYSSEDHVFDAKEIQLLQEVTDDLAFSLENIHRDRMFKSALSETIEQKSISDSLIKCLPGILYMYDSSGKFIKWNENFEKVSGYGAKEISRMHPLDFFDDDQKKLLEEKIKSVFENGYDEVTANFVTKSGFKIPHYFNGRRIEINGRPHLIGIGLDISRNIAAEQRLIDHAQEIRRLNSYLQTIREEERTNISREIHDVLGQQLTALKMDASWLRKHFAGQGDAINRLSEMLDLIDNTIKTVRKISAQLRPAILDDFGLVAALEWQSNDFEKKTGIRSTFESELPEIVIDESMSTNIFRIYQESLTNVARHSSATSMTTRLSIDEGHLKLTIIDDGVGIDPAKKPNDSLGIVGMRERARLFHGKLRIENAHPSGTMITLLIPIQHQHETTYELSDL